MAHKGTASMVSTIAVLSGVRFLTILGFAALSYVFWLVFDGFVVRGFLTLVPALFACQILLNDLLESYLTVQLNWRSRWFTALIAPGTILHELCHFFAAVLTGCTVTDVSLFRRDPKTNVLGYVNYRQPRDKWTVVRDLVVGFAPFFGCGLLLLLVFGILSAYASLDLLTPPAQGFDVANREELTSSFTGIAGSYLAQFALLAAHPWLWLLIYLELCFGLGSAPSSQDFKGALHSAFWHPLSLLFLLALAAGFIYLTENPDVFLGYAPLFSTAVELAFAWALLVLVASIAMLVLALPLVSLIPALADIKSIARYLPPLLFFGVFHGTGNAVYAAGAFIISYALVKYPSLYLEQHPRR